TVKIQCPIRMIFKHNQVCRRNSCGRQVFTYLQTSLIPGKGWIKLRIQKQVERSSKYQRTKYQFLEQRILFMKQHAYYESKLQNDHQKEEPRTHAKGLTYQIGHQGNTDHEK